jgi:hypothetical protein
MAKDKKADKKADKNTKADAKAEKAAEREFKFGVEDIAERLDIKPASVRVQLRNKGIEKAGKSYGWNSKADLDEVIAQLKAKDDGEKSSKKSSKKDDAKSDKKSGKGKKEKKDK